MVYMHIKGWLLLQNYFMHDAIIKDAKIPR